ncbi:hemagglutinin repeat-containing protein [Fusobacterium necrophorum]|uniref:hemagglutinin repeat-containing protein n=1 Tax=Fusobacterium necrophorum TaxID=859 RepID=UPI0025514EAB|nr:hemagglutinin repeat-containing protein [Fusobacterium necrophorum]MDK4521603.1 hemagglutinin repeat-containing protein [Fusobacterium necrophorum]
MKKRMGILYTIFMGLSLYAANVEVDKQASPNLRMDKAPNGIPLVNIEAPDEKGWSHNVFREYHVGKEGIIYNNGLYFSDSQLGGVIYGNPNLQVGQKTAGTILTEISGSGRSKLEGFTEIAGDKANYILANPNGIYINGAGFLNTPQVTLTTGKADTETVSGGKIEIDGKGVDLRNVNRSAFITRVAELSGPVYGGKEVIFQLGKGVAEGEEKPEFSFDARALGSLYAGRIEIISNEKGVGVKSLAPLRATAADLHMSVQGKAELKTAEAKTKIQLEAEAAKIQEKLLVEKSIQMKLQTLENRGEIAANETVQISGDVQNHHRISANKNILLQGKTLVNEGELLSNQEMTIEMEQFENKKKAESKEMKITAREVKNTGNIAANFMNVTIEKLKNEGDFIAYQDGKAKISQWENTKRFQTGELDSDVLKNYGKILTRRDFGVRHFENQGQVSSLGNISIQSAKNGTEGRIQSQREIKIASSLENEGKIQGKTIEIHHAKNRGEIGAIENLKAYELENHGILEARNIQIHNQGKLFNGGYLQSTESGSLEIHAKELENAKEIHSDNVLHIKTEVLKNQGNILSKNLLDVETAHLENANILYGGKQVGIQTGVFQNTGKIYSNHTMKLKATEMDLDENILAKDLLQVETDRLKLDKGYITESDLELRIKGDYKNSKELVAKNLSLQAENIHNESLLGSKGRLTLKSKKLFNRENALLFSREDSVLHGETLENHGEIYSGKNLHMEYTDSIRNLTARMEAEGDIGIKTKLFENKGHLTGDYSKKWVKGSHSSLDVQKLPKSFLKRVDEELQEEYDGSGRRHKRWEGEKYLSRAEEGESHYISHKSFVRAGKNLDIIADRVLNQEADIVVNQDFHVKAKEFINTREKKEIKIRLQFAREYSYKKRLRRRHKRTHSTFRAVLPWKQDLYSDKSTRVLVGGKLSIEAKKVGNGEYTQGTESIFKQSPSSFQIINNVQSPIFVTKKTSEINPLPYLTLPTGENGQFRMSSPDSNPKFSYLIETNPRFTDKGMYLGSDYFFSRISFNPDRNIRLLGDSYYETKLINQAVLEGTGKRYLYSSDHNVERKMLFDAGIKAQKDLQLSLGIALTKEQLERLTSDILWYVEEEVHGEKVLVPKLYLSSKTIAAISEQKGNILSSGNDLEIQAMEVANTGKIEGEKKVLISAQDFSQEALYETTGVKGERVKVSTTKDLQNLGGEFLAKEEMILESKGKLQNEKKISIHKNDYHDVFSTSAGSGKIQGKSVSVSGKRVENKGAEIQAKEKVFIFGEEGISLDTVETLSGKVSGSPNNYVKTEQRRNLGSEVHGERVELLSGKDILVKGSKLSAEKELDLAAKENIEVVAAQDSDLYERHKEKSKSFGRGSSETEIHYTTSHRASQLQGENVELHAGKDIAVLGSHIQAGVEGKAVLEAEGKITQAGVKDTEYSFHEKTKTGFLGITKKTKSQESYQEEAVKSATVAGEQGAYYDAKHDLVLEGVNVVSTGKVTLQGKNISLKPLETTSWTEVKEKKRGFAGSIGNGGVSVSYGTDKKSQKDTQKTQNISEITSGKTLTIAAEETLTGSSVNLYGREGIRVTGEEGIHLSTAKNTREVQQKQSSTRVGANIGVKSELLNTVENIKNLDKLVDSSGDGYAVLNTASNLVGAIKDGSAALNHITKESYGKKTNAKGKQDLANDNYRVLSTNWKDYLSAGVSLTKKKAESRNYQEEVVQNQMESEGNIVLSSKQGSISLEGTEIKTPKDVKLLAKEKIEVRAAEQKNAFSSSSSQRGAGLDMNGSLTASASGQKGRGEGTSYVNSHIQAGGDYQVLAKEILHEGANVKAGTIHMKGEKILVASKQDTSHQKDSSYGGSLSFSVNPKVALNSVQLSARKGKGKGVWVNEQTSLLAEHGGEIVAEHLENRGAIFASESETNQLKIRAHHLEVHDLEDSHHYENRGGGVSLSSKVPNISVSHDKIEKEQKTRATAVNTEFVIAGEGKKAEELEFNTELSKAQEISKEKEKHLNAQLHTDLLGKDKQEELQRAGKVLQDVQRAAINEENTKGDFLERYRRERIMRGISEVVAKNPEWLSVLDMTVENSGKSEAELERAKAAVMNQAMNQFVISRGYQVKYDQEGNAILPITTIVTKISDPNTPMYMSATGDQFVIDEEYVLSMTKEQALNGIGHEYGHYSKADDIATRDQTVANHTGKRVEDLTKNLSSKPVSEATWKNLVNTSSVITGPGADVIANRIPVDEREYVNWHRLGEGVIETGISGVRIAQGAGEVTVGAGILSTGVGFVPGGLLAGHGSSEVVFGVNDGVAGLHKIWLAILEKDDVAEKNYLREKFGEGYSLFNYMSAASTSQTQTIKHAYGNTEKLSSSPREEPEKGKALGYKPAKGYEYVRKGVIRGPKGGEYTEVGKTAQGSIVYKGSGGYRIFEGGRLKAISSGEIVERVPGKEVFYGGRKGNLKTRAQNEKIADYLKKEDWEITGGGNKAKEEYMKPLVEGDKKGANYIDVTAKKMIDGKEVTIRINTVDIDKKTGALTNRETTAEQLINTKIQRENQGNPELITIPKGQGLGNLEEMIKKSVED